MRKCPPPTAASAAAHRQRNRHRPQDRRRRVLHHRLQQRGLPPRGCGALPRTGSATGHILASNRFCGQAAIPALFPGASARAQRGQPRAVCVLSHAGAVPVWHCVGLVCPTAHPSAGASVSGVPFSLFPLFSSLSCLLLPSSIFFFSSQTFF